MALVPSSIGSTLTSGGIDQFFTNVKDAVQSVSTVYDQITGKSESVPAQAVVTSSAPVPAPSFPAIPWKMIGIGVVIVTGLALVLRK